VEIAVTQDQGGSQCIFYLPRLFQLFPANIHDLCLYEVHLKFLQIGTWYLNSFPSHDMTCDGSPFGILQFSLLLDMTSAEWTESHCVPNTKKSLFKCPFNSLYIGYINSKVSLRGLLVIYQFKMALSYILRLLGVLSLTTSSIQAPLDTPESWTLIIHPISSSSPSSTTSSSLPTAVCGAQCLTPTTAVVSSPTGTASSYYAKTGVADCNVQGIAGTPLDNHNYNTTSVSSVLV